MYKIHNFCVRGSCVGARFIVNVQYFLKYCSGQHYNSLIGFTGLLYTNEHDVPMLSSSFMIWKWPLQKESIIFSFFSIHAKLYLRYYIASFSTVKHAISENAYNELTIIMMKWSASPILKTSRVLSGIVAVPQVESGHWRGEGAISIE